MSSHIRSPGGIVLMAVLVILGMLTASDAGGSVLNADQSVLVHSSEGISEYRLENDMRVLLIPDASAPMITVNVTYRVGSRHEHYGGKGIAHLLEHLMFKGTQNHPDIPGEMKARGVEFNATTTRDYTSYLARFSADSATLTWLLSMEADRMTNAKIERASLDSEMTVVRNELEARQNSPVQLLVDQMLSTAYQLHNYGSTPLGVSSDLENMPIEQLQAFYSKYYQPDNATLIISGNFDAEVALSLASDKFGSLARPTRLLRPTHTREPAQGGERSVVVRRAGGVAYVGVGYHVPAARHADSAAILLLSDVMGFHPGGRLHKALVESGKATDAFEVYFSLDEPGYVTFLAAAAEDHDLDVLEADLLHQLEGVGKMPILEKELTAARDRILVDYEIALRDPHATAQMLSDPISRGDWRLTLLGRDRIEMVKLEDLQRVASIYLQRDNRTSGRFIPTDGARRLEIEEAPAATDLLQSFVERETGAVVESFEATKENIEARTKVSTLANGTRVAIVDKKSRAGAVHVRMSFRLGDEMALMNRGHVGEAVAAQLKYGIEELDGAGIEEAMTSLKARFGFSGGAAWVNVAVLTDRDHIQAVLALIAKMLKSPTLDPASFEQLRMLGLTNIRSNMSSPDMVVKQEMKRHFNRRPNGHPYGADSFEGLLGRLTVMDLESVRAFHREFYGAGPGATIAVVGDVDADALHTQLETLFGGWTAAIGYARIPQPYRPLPVVYSRIQLADRPNAVIVAMQALPVGQDHKDYPALQLGNHVLGGGTVKSRLADRLRQLDGISYTVGSDLDASAIEETGTFSMYATAAAGNMAVVEAALRDELHRILDKGIDEIELAEAREGMLRMQRSRYADDQQLVEMIHENIDPDQRSGVRKNFEARLRALTPEAVQAAMVRQLDPDALSVFIAGDFDAEEVVPVK